MKLIVREYLGMLRESGEFDLLLPDLLIQMGLTPTTKAQKGVRQDGVDLSAVGPDDNDVDNLWLFVIKRGDIGRSEWSSGPQSVRQSLEEISDIYLRSHISKEHSDLPIKIIVTTTGDLKQDTETNWSGYTQTHTVDGIEYEFWGGDKVASLIVDNMLDEYALPPDDRSLFRRALALISEPQYDYSDFHKLLRRQLSWDIIGSNKSAAALKKCSRSIKTTSLTLAIICRWSIEEGNVKNAIIAAERTMLWAWDAIRKAELTEEKLIVEAYLVCVSQYLAFTIEYVNKVQPYLVTAQSLARYYSEASLLRERVFEEIGMLSTIAMVHMQWGSVTSEEYFSQNAIEVAKILSAFLRSHTCAASPVYDGNSVEISIAILALLITGHSDELHEWLNEIVSRLDFSYKTNRWFPVSTDSFDDLLDFELRENNADVDKLKNISTIIPLLAQWAAMLNYDELYGFIHRIKESLLPETCCQLWYPDENTENYLYNHAAQFESGITEAPMIIPDTLEEMISSIQELHEDSPVDINLVTSASSAGLPWLEIVASRHFGTPLNPILWQTVGIEISKKLGDQVPPGLIE